MLTQQKPNSDPLGFKCHHGLFHPTVKIFEFVNISEDLAKRLVAQNHIAVFANKTDDKNDGTTTGSSIYALDPVHMAKGSDGFQSGSQSWGHIVGKLLELKTICESGVSVPNAAKLLHDTIEFYCPKANSLSNFDVLNNKEIGDLVIKAIPKIIVLATQLPLLFSKQIPILKAGEIRTIYLPRKLIASLLANAFFCTFPEPQKIQGTPSLNFFTLFHTDPKYPASAAIKREKLKCFLNYFDKMSKDFSGQHQIVSFERRCVQKRAGWLQSPKFLNAVQVDSKGKIEDCRGMLQVDFANRVIGGGVYMEGCVMEDIRFCISPELVVARLFTQHLENDEVLVVTGSEIFSEYMGYGRTFKYKCPSDLKFNQATDSYGRTYTQIVCMDAHYFKSDNKQQQFEQTFLDRELHKCYVAFIHGPNFVSPLATGNWGCGQFNGDKELKFLIQWMAASIQDRPKIQFHTVDDIPFSKAIEDISDNLRKRNVTVGQLYKTVCKFHSAYSKHGKGGIFKYVKNKI